MCAFLSVGLTSVVGRERLNHSSPPATLRDKFIQGFISTIGTHNLIGIIGNVMNIPTVEVVERHEQANEILELAALDIQLLTFGVLSRANQGPRRNSSDECISRQCFTWTTFTNVDLEGERLCLQKKSNSQALISLEGKLGVPRRMQYCTDECSIRKGHLYMCFLKTSEQCHSIRCREAYLLVQGRTESGQFFRDQWVNEALASSPHFSLSSFELMGNKNRSADENHGFTQECSPQSNYLLLNIVKCMLVVTAVSFEYVVLRLRYKLFDFAISCLLFIDEFFLIMCRCIKKIMVADLTRPAYKKWRQKAIWLAGAIWVICLLSESSACTDIRKDLPGQDCLEYDYNRGTFELTCSLNWSSSDDCIVLRKNEVFEGNGHLINITGFADWVGLFKINDSTASSPSSLDDSPVIRNVHMVGGETSDRGGFIVYPEQHNFIVEFCSSSGMIYGDNSGGICGDECSGYIVIRYCSSSGEIYGEGAGGIVGGDLGNSAESGSGTINITQCYSTGDISGYRSGGICGVDANRRSDGDTFITHSYSIGAIRGASSGGICGHYAGGGTSTSMGTLTIAQCYSLGEIHGPNSGGIAGTWAGGNKGPLYIKNCYSRGNITGSSTGGICGGDAAANGGLVIVTNVYASGRIKCSDAGGLIGDTRSNSEVRITMSVYDGTTNDIVGENNGDFIEEKNSGNLADIISTVYCYTSEDDDTTEDECWNDKTIWQAVDSGFPNLLPPPSPTPTPSSSATSSSTASRTRTPTQTYTATSTNTGTITSSPSPSETSSSSFTRTSSSTHSRTSTRTSTNTKTGTPSVTGTVSPSATSSSSRTCSQTSSATSTSTTTNTVTGPSSITESPSSLASQSISTIGLSRSPSPISSLTPTPRQVRVDPDTIEFDYSRSILDAPKIERSVLISLRVGQMLRWIRPPDPFLQVPPDVKAAGDPSSTEIEQVIGIQVSKVPQGRTERNLQAQVLEGDSVMSTLSVRINITISQGHVQANTKAIRVTASQSETSMFRSVRISNAGTHNVTWMASIFDTNGNNRTASDTLPWLSVDKLHGTIATTKSTTTFETQLSPNKVGGTGIFQAWILVQTDSWDGVALIAESSASYILKRIPHSRIYFWIRVEMLVTSVFLCTGSEIPALQPMDARIQTFTILNTEMTGISVLPTNFTLVVKDANNDTSIYSLQPQFLNNAMKLSHWMLITPGATTILTGRSVTYQLTVFFPSKMLSFTDANLGEVNVSTPLSMTLRMGFGVFFGAVSSLQTNDAILNNADDFRDISTELHYKPGLANANYSYIKVIGGRMDIPVTDSIDISVALVDQFRQVPAVATYYTTDNVNKRDESAIYLQLLPAGDVSIRLTTRPRLSNGQTTSGFLFTIQFISTGEIKVDTVLNGTSISGSPIVLEGRSINCPGPYEVPSNDGFQCLCRAGYRRSERQPRLSSDGGTLGCIPCQEGLITFAANRDFQCTLCPGGSFCTGGSSIYTPCTTSGVDCTDGKLRLKDGIWCEPCASESYPRTTISRLLEVNNPPLFHKCFREESCVVNTTSFESTCTRGYKGPVCSVCEDNFALDSENTACVPCDEEGLDQLLVVVGVVVILVILLVFTYRHSVKARRDQTVGDNQCGNVGATVTSDAETANSTGISGTYHNPTQKQETKDKHTKVNNNSAHTEYGIKGEENINAPKQLEDLALLVMDYLQICSILSRLRISPFQRVSAFFVELSQISLLNPSESSQFQCTFHVDYFLRTIISMLFPWILLVAIALCQVVVSKLLLRTSLTKTSLLQGVLPVAFIAFNQLHASVTSTTVTALQAYPHEIDGRMRAYGDLTIVVGSSKHSILFTVAFSTLVVYVVGFPLVLTIVLLLKWRAGKFEELYHRFESLTSPGTFLVQRLGFVWPPVLILRKVLLLLFSRFINDGMGQYLSVTLTLVVSYIAVTWIRPYRFKSLNNIEELKIGLSLVTVGLGAFLYTVSEMSSFPNAEVFIPALVVAFQAFGLIAVLVAACFMLPRLLREIRNILIPKAARLLKCGSCRKSSKQGDRAHAPPRNPTQTNLVCSNQMANNTLTQDLNKRKNCVAAYQPHFDESRRRLEEFSTANPAFAPRTRIMPTNRRSRRRVTRKTGESSMKVVHRKRIEATGEHCSMSSEDMRTSIPKTEISYMMSEDRGMKTRNESLPTTIDNTKKFASVSKMSSEIPSSRGTSRRRRIVRKVKSLPREVNQRGLPERGAERHQ